MQSQQAPQIGQTAKITAGSEKAMAGQLMVAITGISSLNGGSNRRLPAGSGFQNWIIGELTKLDSESMTINRIGRIIGRQESVGYERSSSKIAPIFNTCNKNPKIILNFM